MPITQAAMKALRQAKKKAERNRKVKDSLTFFRRSVRKALETKDAKKAAELAKDTIKTIDRAVQKKILKRNTGARFKSRLMLSINKAVAAAK
ncbi:30S ribosomal protein S20 [Candidatus Uhrbacteria bacterium]|nr:30S ribosomal protein S20 [Candidatus Uhrbacteria bacterium]